MIQGQYEVCLGIDKPSGEGGFIPGHLSLYGVLRQDVQGLIAERVLPGVGRGITLQQLVAQQNPGENKGN